MSLLYFYYIQKKKTRLIEEFSSIILVVDFVCLLVWMDYSLFYLQEVKLMSPSLIVCH